MSPAPHVPSLMFWLGYSSGVSAGALLVSVGLWLGGPLWALVCGCGLFGLLVLVGCVLYARGWP